MIYHFVSKRPPSRGTTLLLTVFLMVVLLGIVAFAVDLGYITLARTQLQTAADSAALAAAGALGQNDQIISEARKFGEKNSVGATPVKIQAADVIVGTWDSNKTNPNERFIPLADQSQPGNAVKVTTRADGTTAETPPLHLFFAKVWNRHTANITAEAVATTNPRDICFVFDLSSSMNDDSDPYGSPFHQDLVQNLYNDFGFGTYPGTQQYAGQPFSGIYSISNLTDTTSNSNNPLLWYQPQTVTLTTGNTYTIPDQYRIQGTTTTTTTKEKGKWVTTTTYTVTDSPSEVQRKAYAWVMEEQLYGKSCKLGQNPNLPGIMPAMLPVPDGSSTANATYKYWKTFIDTYSSQLGYKRYVYFMMVKGRDVKETNSGLYTPWAVGVPGDLNPNCVRNADATPIPGVSLALTFPAREQPTHSCRRAAIAAIQYIWDRNANTPANLCDYVSIITFDTQAGTSDPPVHNLDNNYETAMRQCADLQATGAPSYCTATGYGLRKAIEYLSAHGRPNANKVVVLLTDGMPNIYVVDPEHSLPLPPDFNQLDYGNNAKDSALLEASVILGKNWMFFPVGLGLDCDQDFMNRMYSVSQGLNNPNLTNPYNGGSDPYQMESKLREVFQKILSNPKLKLVQ